MDRSLFDLLFSLHFELVNVVGHSAIVLVGTRYRRLLDLFNLGMHLIYGLIDIILHEVLLLPRWQLIQVDSFRHRALSRFSSLGGGVLLWRSLAVL